MEIERAYRTNFYTQRMSVTEIGVPRLDFYKQVCRGKKVLHVGCTDWPVFNPDNNLHVQLQGVPSQLDGLDIDLEGLKLLGSVAPGAYYSSYEYVKERYELVLVPEVIEHVPNVAHFLSELSSIQFDSIILAAPCVIGYPHAFSYAGLQGSHQADLTDGNDYIEEVHPDHKAWYSPYTLANAIQMSTNWEIAKICLMDNRRSVVAVCHRNFGG